MSIRINREKCIGCKKCMSVCPGSLIAEKEGKACMKYPRDCWGCVSCVKECPVGAIDFFLGADIGGNGSILNVEYEGDILHWKIQTHDSSTGEMQEICIDVNSKNANNY